MSGPQGPDPTKPWQPPQGEGQQSGEEHDPARVTLAAAVRRAGLAGPGGEQQTWHAPAYTPTEYGQYQQPPAQYYPPSQPYPAGLPAARPVRRPDRRVRPAPPPIRPAGPVRPARAVRPARSVRSARPVRPAGPVPPARSVRPVPGALRPAAGRPEAVAGGDRHGARRVRRHRRRGGLGAGLLGAGVLRDHQAGRQQGPGRRAADPRPTAPTATARRTSKTSSATTVRIRRSKRAPASTATSASTAPSVR